MVRTLPSSAVSVGLIAGLGAKILHASWPKKKKKPHKKPIKQKQYSHKLKKKFLNGLHKKYFKNLKIILLKVVGRDLVNRYFLSTYYVARTVLDIKDSVMIKTDKDHCPCGACILVIINI